MVDLLTSQKLTWKKKSSEDDGRVFEVKALEQSEDPELLQVVSDARTALIEQVHDHTLRASVRNDEILRCP